MSNYNNQNSGALFKNQYKDSPNKPDMTGKVQTCCEHCKKDTEFRVAAWTKRPNGGGDPFLSLAFTALSEGAARPQPARVDSSDLDALMGAGSAASGGRPAAPASTARYGQRSAPRPTVDLDEDDIPF